MKLSKDCHENVKINKMSESSVEKHNLERITAWRVSKGSLNHHKVHIHAQFSNLDTKV